MFTILIFIIVLSVLVFVHELGHFCTARRLGVKAEEFGFGFPPRALGFYKDKHGRRRWLKGNAALDTLPEDISPSGTVYSINWLPIGGFVRIKGENGEEKKESDSFSAKPIWQRAVILSAGVAMNILLAILLLSVGYMIGLPKNVDEARKGAIISSSKVYVMEVLPGSPAEQAGLLTGDVIKSVNGQAVENNAQLQEAIASLSGAKGDFEILRGNENFDIDIAPVFSENTGHSAIGVSIYASGLVRYGLFQSLLEGVRETGLLFYEIIFAFASLIGGIFSGADVSGQVAGPVGIATLTGQVANLGFSYLLQFMAILSLNLALINILPLPALDGGRILFLAIEKIKGKPVRQSVEAWIHTIGFWLLIILIVLVTYQDIARMFVKN